MEQTVRPICVPCHDDGCSAAFGTILVVDDEPTVRRLIVRTLLAHRYQVLAAGSCQEAHDCFALEGARIRVLVSDVMLDDGNGITLAGELRQRSLGLRVLLISGRMDEAWGACIQSNGYSFLSKPFEMSRLLGQVREMLG